MGCLGGAPPAAWRHAMALAAVLWSAGPAVAQPAMTPDADRAEAGARDTLTDTGLRGELKRFLHDEAKATLHVRSFFFDKVNPKPPDNVALTLPENSSRFGCLVMKRIVPPIELAP